MIDRLAYIQTCPIPAAGISRRLPRHRLLVALLAGGILQGCGEPAVGPEEGLRQWVARGEQAANDKDRPTIVDMISPAYVDGRGNSRDDIANLLRAYFFRMRSVGLITRIDELTVIGETAAELVLTVGMAGTHSGTLGFSADAYRFELELEFDGDDWLLLGASWGELGGEIR